METIQNMKKWYINSVLLCMLLFISPTLFKITCHGFNFIESVVKVPPKNNACKIIRYDGVEEQENTTCRRSFLKLWGVSNFVFVAFVSSKSNAAVPEDDVKILKDGLDTLTALVDNWERATVDCNYADVPRELLEQKNKDLLLEKASTWALFDKSTSVVSCKRTNRLVRDYIGLTGKGPLVGAERRMLQKQIINLVDPELIDQYFSEVESFSQSMSSASSLSYTAGIADFDSINNFEKGTQESGNESSLEKARKAIVDAKNSLQIIVAFLSSEK